MIRTGAPLIRHLVATISLEAGGIYNRLPLFVMPEDSDEILRHEGDLIESAPEILPMPFDDFLLDFPFGTSAVLNSLPSRGRVERGRLWVRVRRFEAIRPDDPATTLRWDQLSPLCSLRDGLLLEVWEEQTAWGGLPPYPDYSAINITRPCIGDFTAHWHLYPAPECPAAARPFGRGLGWCNLACCTHPEHNLRCSSSEMIQSLACRLTVLALIYITEGLGGTVTEVSWAPARGSREEKTERLKPWVAPRRETYIIIDPARSSEYGHPSRVRPDSAGHHASPVPHARRGHWRRLPTNRKTWVRPAWVGAREWQYNGRTYKIIPGGNT